MDYSTYTYHPESEKLVNLMSAKTQNPNLAFFRILVPYYWSLVAATMQAKIVGFGDGEIPINYYGINLAPSGTGKGVSQGIMEKQVLRDFKDIFLNETFIQAADHNLAKIAARRAVKNNTDQAEELTAAEKDFKRLGAPLLWFDSATSPAIKQFRHKLLMAGCGAVNFTIDEIGANLLGQTEPLNLYLELFDHGMAKEKLIKSTADNIRTEIIEGSTPTNALLFGSQGKLFDGAGTEKQFFDMLEMGYARRCFFGFVENAHRKQNVTADDLYQQLMNSATTQSLDKLSHHLGTLARPAHLNKKIIIPPEQAKLVLQYRLDCEERAAGFKDHESIKKSEMDNRFFKVLKLAGAYAFIEGLPEISEDHVKYAIRLAEDSGESFMKMVTPVRPYVKFAQYLADNSGEEFTLPDLEEDLAFFRGGRNQKDEIIAMATAWGYKNNTIIRKRFDSSIMFIRGESLQETSMESLIVSYSTDMTYNYLNQEITWDNLKKLVAMKDYHWMNHQVVGGHRLEDNCMQGFNLLVLDVDGGTPISVTKILLKDYSYLIYTTKRHQTEGMDRYRIIIPMSHKLAMDREDFSQFFVAIQQFLPIKIDEQGILRTKKWLTNDKAQVFVNDGKLLDVLPFIPRTSKDEERQAELKSLRNLDSLERWFVANTGEGNRNNQLFKYAAMLADTGNDLADISMRLRALNDKLPDKLTEEELTRTVMQSVQAKLQRSKE